MKRGVILPIRGVYTFYTHNEKYKNQPLKWASTKREGELIRSLLASQPKSAILLDLPSGGGRLSPELEPFAGLIIETDIALGQVLYGRSTSALKIPQVWMQASAFNIPLRDRSVDGVFCCRLCLISRPRSSGSASCANCCACPGDLS